MSGPGDPRHGTEGGYTNQRCRCSRCTDAHTAAVLRRKSERPPLPPDDPRHGTYNAYSNHGCRCQACRDASAEYARRRYASQRDRT